MNLYTSNEDILTSNNVWWRDLEVLPGTIVGVRVNDGVVIGGEKRLTYNGFILSRNTRKVYPITDHVGVGFAGLMGDIEFLVKILKLEARNYRLQLNREIKPKGLAKILSIILYSYKLAPLLTEVIVGGYSSDGPQLFVLDPVGSLIEERYTALGSGGRVAIGYIEPRYKEDLDIRDAKELVINGIKTAIERDAVSGDGVDLLVITSEGYKLEEYLFKRESKV
ncbi:MAG: proteasome subunit beta [Desulfurococcales archaeon ex4484_58]|nr:MAG: proteasome subunit beta [Desulfurococcales archaeon ex4484_58]